jgi:hypothetical protein
VMFLAVILITDVFLPYCGNYLLPGKQCHLAGCCNGSCLSALLYVPLPFIILYL